MDRQLQNNIIKKYNYFYMLIVENINQNDFNSLKTLEILAIKNL